MHLETKSLGGQEFRLAFARTAANVLVSPARFDPGCENRVPPVAKVPVRGIH